MKTIAGRAVDQRTVRVLYIDRLDDLPRCHALFVPEGAMRVPAPQLLRKAEALDVLTVGDADGFAASGGMIGLASDGDRMRFQINDKAVKRTNLKLAAQLLQLGHAVQEGGAR